VFFLPGLVGPYLYVMVKQSQRLAKFLAQLPDTLQLMSGSLSAGYGVLQAIDLVADEAGEPIASEFQRVLVEARLGMPLEDSLEGMADRMDSDDFRWVVLAMNIQREVGGNLADLLRTVAQTLRDREALRRHIKALAAEGKLSAIILVILPFFLAGYLILVNPTYVGTLTESVFGWILIGIGVIGIIVGMVWIRNLIRAIEV
jgi:tight adherence protein B